MVNTQQQAMRNYGDFALETGRVASPLWPTSLPIAFPLNKR